MAKAHRVAAAPGTRIQVLPASCIGLRSRVRSQAKSRLLRNQTLCYLLISFISRPPITYGQTQRRLRMAQKRYSPIHAPTLSMSELVCKTLDCDATDLLIDKWLEHRNDAYWDWFQRVRERKHVANAAKKGQVLLWNKGAFVPENIFCRTVDTGRLIPLDRTWTTHVYHHKSMQERRFSMMPVVFTMVRSCLFLIRLSSTSLNMRPTRSSRN